MCGRLGEPSVWIAPIYWYVGNRDLIWSWVPKYLIQPFGASVLAVVFYLVIRGGFFSLMPVHNTLPLRIHSAQRATETNARA